MCGTRGGQRDQAGDETPEDCEWGRLTEDVPAVSHTLEGAAELRNQVGGAEMTPFRVCRGGLQGMMDTLRADVPRQKRPWVHLKELGTVWT